MKANYDLSRVMGETVLTLMEFTTLLSQIEAMHRVMWAMLISLPLTLSDDPSELNILTLGYFLFGISMATVPENNPSSRLQQSDLSNDTLSRHSINAFGKWKGRLR